MGETSTELAGGDVLYTVLTDEVGADIGILTLNRPDQRNALTHAMYAAIESTARAAHEGSIRCLVITGVDPAFCSGDDVRQVMGAGEEGRAPTSVVGDRRPRLTPASEALLFCDVPVIAAINGPAVGWGMELALMADIRVASERARLGELFVKRGLVSDAAGIGRLAQIVGRETAAEMLFTGDIVDAQQAAKLRLVSRVVPHAALMETTVDLARRIAGNPPLAVRRLKQGLRETLDPDWHGLGEWVSATLGELFTTEDHREGVRSFLEKRPARFVGR
jgi:enoyl-CoA hydratase/carnithine racemase